MKVENAKKKKASQAGRQLVLLFPPFPALSPHHHCCNIPHIYTALLYSCAHSKGNHQREPCQTSFDCCRSSFFRRRCRRIARSFAPQPRKICPRSRHTSKSPTVTQGMTQLHSRRPFSRRESSQCKRWPVLLTRFTTSRVCCCRCWTHRRSDLISSTLTCGNRVA